MTRLSLFCFWKFKGVSYCYVLTRKRSTFFSLGVWKCMYVSVYVTSGF